jgi:hypothetical protein
MVDDTLHSKYYTGTSSLLLYCVVLRTVLDTLSCQTNSEYEMDFFFFSLFIIAPVPPKNCLLSLYYCKDALDLRRRLYIII